MNDKNLIDVKQGKLVDEINYQEGTIVSKQILKKDKGNITFFAFDKDEILSEHISPFEALVYIADGIIEIKIDGTPYKVSTGEFIRLPRDVPHALKAKVKSKMLLIMIKE
jgi:quercetin dioxygenase-like cupin family protein